MQNAGNNKGYVLFQTKQNTFFHELCDIESVKVTIIGTHSAISFVQ